MLVLFIFLKNDIFLGCVQKFFSASSMLLFSQSKTLIKTQVSLRGRPPLETALPLGCWFWLRRLFHDRFRCPYPDVGFEVRDLLHQRLWWIKPSPKEGVDLVFRFVQLRSQCLHCASRGSRTTILVLRPLGL